MANVYSVSQVNSYIKNMFTQDFMLNRISVRGEVSNCKRSFGSHFLRHVCRTEKRVGFRYEGRR